MPRSLFAIVLAALLCLRPEVAHAEEPGVQERAQIAFAGVDKVFGKYVVAPLGAVLFWDVIFWDNTLPKGEVPVPQPPEAGTAEEMEEWVEAQLSMTGAVPVSYDEEEGYAYSKRMPVFTHRLIPVVEEPVRKKLGAVEVEIKTVEGALVGRLVPAVIDAARYLPPVAGDEQAGEAGEAGTSDEKPARVTIENEALAPFPVTIDTASGMMEEAVVPVDPAWFPVVAGMSVLHGESRGSVVLVDGERASIFLAEGGSFEKAALPNPKNLQFPLVVVWLVLGAAFFTVRMMLINVRGFAHAIAVTAGRYDDPDDPGEISHFNALSSALSATVGLGNIAGVAIAVSVGGPGAVFWMVMAALLGMSSKFTECTLGQMYRVVKPDGSISGGPMHYLHKGLAELKMGVLGRVLATIFALMCIGGSLGGGNMFQANQSFAAVAEVVPWFLPKAAGEVVFERDFAAEADVVFPAGTVVGAKDASFLTEAEVVLPAGEVRSAAVAVVATQGGFFGNVEVGEIMDFDASLGAHGVTNASATSGGAHRGWLYGLVLAAIVGIVIIGGIKRIGAAAGVIVPLMCGIYVAAGIWILVVHAAEVPAAFGSIVGEAFSPRAGLGGILGVIAQGFKRASFSNEAGIGSASIAHSAAATDQPVREGIVALLEPFIDTVIICSMTGLVVVVTGEYLNGGDGVVMTSRAFGSVIGWFPTVLSFAVVMFAFSTMISWSYYGERCATWLFGDRFVTAYRVMFLFFVFFGAVFSLGNVLEFSDLMVLGMAFPNILGAVILSGKVKRALDRYLEQLRNGEFKRAAA